MTVPMPSAAEAMCFIRETELKPFFKLTTPFSRVVRELLHKLMGPRDDIWRGKRWGQLDKAWSDSDLGDLRYSLEHGDTFVMAAKFLQQYEAEAK